MLIMLACNSENHNNHQHKENKNRQNLSENVIVAIKDSLKDLSNEDIARLEKGVSQAIKLWNSEDGNEQEFIDFVVSNFVAKGDKLDTLFGKLSRNMEIINGHFNKMMLDIKMPVALDWGDSTSN